MHTVCAGKHGIWSRAIEAPGVGDCPSVDELYAAPKRDQTQDMQNKGPNRETHDTPDMTDIHDMTSRDRDRAPFAPCHRCTRSGRWLGLASRTHY